MKSLKMAALAAIAGSLAACGGDDDKDYSYLRVLHASPDAPAVDILVNDEAVVEAAEFQQGTGYLRLSDGAKNVKVRVAGTETIAFETDVTLEADGYYSVLAVNNVADLDLKLIDDTENFFNGENDVTVVHASPSAGDVDIFVTAPDAMLDFAMPTLDAVAFPADATLNDVAAGNYQVRVTPDESEQVVYNSGTVAIGGDLAVVAVNSTKGLAPVSLIAWSASGASVVLDDSAELRVVHAVDSVTVDVFVDGTETLSSVAYKANSGYLTLTSGSKEVAIAAEDTGIDSALESLSGTVSLERGESYTVIAAGDTGDLDAATLIVLEDRRMADDATQANVRLVHGSSASGADPVDIYVYENGTTQPAMPTLNDVTFTQDSGYLTLAPANYTVDITANNSTQAAISGLDNLMFSAGDVKTAIAIGNGSGLEALLLDDSRSSVR